MEAGKPQGHDCHHATPCDTMSPLSHIKHNPHYDLKSWMVPGAVRSWLDPDAEVHAWMVGKLAARLNGRACGWLSLRPDGGSDLQLCSDDELDTYNPHLGSA